MEPLADIINRLGDGDQVVAYKAYQSLLKLVGRASDPANKADRALMAKTLAEALNATKPGGKDDKGKEKPPVIKHPAGMRNKIARLLSTVAGAGEVEALVKAMKDIDVREMARFALDRNTSAEATAALVKAVDAEVGPEFRTGVVGALGKRTGSGVVETLRKCAEDVNAEVRISAAESLSNFADASNDAVIAKQTEGGPMLRRNRAHRARVRLAETLRLAGDRSAAARIYSAIRSSDAPGPQKEAAEMGLKALG